MPCMRFVPHEQDLVRPMREKPFALIGISQDDYNVAFRARVQKAGITWPSFQDTRKSRPDITHLFFLLA
jgi:hypothetical protein